MGGTSGGHEDLIGQAWEAVSSDGAPAGQPPPAHVDVTGSTGHLPSPFAVEGVAVAAVAASLLAATALGRQRGSPTGAVSLDRGHVADAVRSERFFVGGGGSGGAGFAPLSRFWAVRDGWVRTHANYPWHRAALRRTLGLSPDADADAVAVALADLRAEEVEERVFAGGGIATAVRTPEAWRAHPQGRAVAAEPLVGHRQAGRSAARTRPAGDLPMAHVRVLDLTRVIAGPVCTRFLAALGAEVLRLDPPHHPDMKAGVVADTLLGKRSSFVDYGSAPGLATLHDLLDGADVVVCGYRPGSLDRFGLGEDDLVERHPGIVAVYLSAWGHSGPWAGRRGFDSVVQAPTGIAVGESTTGDVPGALPCQLLDHGTGYLAAAAALDGLRRQGTEGGTHVRRLSLARTAWWLTSLGTRTLSVSDPPAADPDRRPWLVELEGGSGPVTAVAPPGRLGEQALRWPFPPSGYAEDPASWPDVRPLSAR